MATKGANEKFCSECGEIINAKAEICPKCGVRQMYPPFYFPDWPRPITHRITAGLLGIFFGGFGAHKFYMGRVAQGVVYVLLCWTFIPFIVGIVEGILYLTMSDQAFTEKYFPKPQGSAQG